MTTAFDIKFGNLGLNGLNKYGKSATYKSIQPGVYVPATGLVTPGAPVSFAAKVLLVDPSSEEYINNSDPQTQENLLPSVMRTMFVSGLAMRNAGVSPKAGDKVTLDAFDWVVINWFPIYSGDLVALYKLGVST